MFVCNAAVLWCFTDECANVHALTHLQDLFVGAWQQADPAVDQVPYTFPPVLASHAGKALPKANKAKKGKAQSHRQTGSKAVPKPQQVHKPGHSSAPALVAAEPIEQEKQISAAKAKVVGPSAAEYAQALYEDL